MINELSLVISISALAVISPGSDFAIVTKNTVSYGRHAIVVDFVNTKFLQI
jgi:threonine/homoserine/homoserine lactone efflux protein